ncbi:hypothetical protein L210DRAFT_942243 [Boletus edulis BED1]|uniref:Uncharacterized protein n=1 Tax=Boletus edulis BED1 TaxID=1328754 RepID=A0AAD4BY05_BOLED|nr:hypothetical protein L210DRAFT_942243 [Boletus edulis BED1]
MPRKTSFAPLRRDSYPERVAGQEGACHKKYFSVHEGSVHARYCLHTFPQEQVSLRTFMHIGHVVPDSFDPSISNPLPLVMKNFMTSISEYQFPAILAGLLSMPLKQYFSNYQTYCGLACNNATTGSNGRLARKVPYTSPNNPGDEFGNI